MKQKIKLISSFILGAIVVLFAMLNWRQAEISLGFYTIKLPLIIVILCSVIAGSVITSLFMSSHLWNKRKEVKNLQKELADTTKIESELHNAND